MFSLLALVKEKTQEEEEEVLISLSFRGHGRG